MTNTRGELGMKKIINKAHIEGRVSECNLEVKVSKKGVTYIGGKVDIATDDACLNIVTVDFPYVAPSYANGKENKNYGVLYPLAIQKNKEGVVVKESSAKTLMDGASKDEATMLRIDPSIDLNEWYKDENGVDVLISTKKLSGGFVHAVTALNADEVARNKFECDMVITSTQFFEGDEEKNTVDKLVIKGCTFDYNGNLLPVEFSVVNPNGINYFQDLDATPNTPVFTKVWGKIVNETITTSVTEESAFGEPVVRETKKTKRDWLITGTSTIPYEFDVEGIITAKELQEAVATRNIALADKLAEQKAREAEKANNSNAFTAAPKAPATGGFSF